MSSYRRLSVDTGAPSASNAERRDSVASVDSYHRDLGAPLNVQPLQSSAAAQLEKELYDVTFEAPTSPLAFWGAQPAEEQPADAKQAKPRRKKLKAKRRLKTKTAFREGTADNIDFAANRTSKLKLVTVDKSAQQRRAPKQAAAAPEPQGTNAADRHTVRVISNSQHCMVTAWSLHSCGGTFLLHLLILALLNACSCPL